MTNTTLKLLAQQLQLSISTVSRALKDHPDISAATKAKVHALANSLDYEPNAYAIQLRTQSSKIFGVIVPAISNLFYDSFISAVEEESRKHDYALMIMQSSNQAESSHSKFSSKIENVKQNIYLFGNIKFSINFMSINSLNLNY